jgi:hypothetical protein
VRRAIGEVFARPEYSWVERRQPLLWLRQLWYRFMDWLDQLSQTHPLGFNVLIGLMIIVLVLILVHVGFVVWRILQPTAQTAARGAGGNGPIHDATRHLAIAEELARAGRYVEALGHRFLAVLLELDRAAALRFHASKTPAEYVGEVRLDEPGRASFGSLVARLYRHLFGAVPCDESEYRAFGTAADELTRHVVPA